MSRVDLEHVTKTYPDGTRAVSDCDLAIDDGELMVLVGPSGCGKSTLLRLIAGLETPSAGTIRLDGKAVNHLRPQERNVAMVFQDYALYPYLSARRNLEFPLRMRRLARSEMNERVERVAAMLGMTALLERLPKQLSGGQRQRVAMGRALVREPSVFLLDEPLSNLDAGLRVQMRAEIKELQERTATTTIYVTHDQVEAMTLGHRVAVLLDGVLQQVAAPGELYDRPTNVFVAGFTGSPPMNLLPAVVVSHDGAILRLRVAGTSLILPSAAKPPRQVGERLTLGVRPEALRIVSGSDAEGDALDAAVEYTEHLGHETLVHLRLAGTEAEGGQPLVLRLDGMRDLSKEERLGIAIDAARARLFREDGTAIE